ncbi:MAG: cation:proton antiporter [Deltaproteobacteria bacterium]|nr:cation:proton antiporter [Deltaproteobacteria bacterium]
METIPLLKDIVILMAVSVPVIFLIARLGLPTIIGFLLTGVVIGPSGFALVTETQTVDTLAQIGVVLLLFTIGLEFSVTRILNIRREGVLGGGLQISLTVLIVMAAGMIWRLPAPVSLLLGFVITLSSTAIVLKLLMDKGEVNSPHGSLSLGILLFQDVSVVLMVMVIQSIGAGNGAEFRDIAKGLGVSLLAFAAIVAAVAVVIPRIFNRVVALRNREIFILTIVLVCLGTAYLTSLFGLSLALGAFIAGLAISESEYSHQIVAEVIPFRDIFSALFFISIGLLLDIRWFAAEAGWIILLVACIFGVKTLALVCVGRILRYPLRLSIMVGLNLAQIGEFSFILIKMGRDYSLLDNGMYQSLLAASVLSMATTPLIYRYSSRIAFEAASRLVKGGGREGVEKTTLSNHVIIAGYGLNGRNLARVLKETSIHHLVIDVNMDRVNEAKKDGHIAYFGDPSHPEILHKMGIDRAKMIVVAISDPISTRRIVKSAGDANPAASILVRTRYIREVEDLYRLGAKQVIPEEFETSVEIFARVLRDYRVPGNIIQNQIDLVRQEGYAMFRHPSMAEGRDRLASLSAILEASLTDTFYVDAGCRVAGMTLEALGVRKKSGATVIAVVRKGEARTNPAAGFLIETGDILVIFGSHAELNAALTLLAGKCPAHEGPENMRD